MASSGWQGAPYFQEIRPEAGFKIGDFVQEKLGGATVERLCLQINAGRSGILDSSSEEKPSQKKKVTI